MLKYTFPVYTISCGCFQYSVNPYDDMKPLEITKKILRNNEKWYTIYHMSAIASGEMWGNLVPGIWYEEILLKAHKITSFRKATSAHP